MRARRERETSLYQKVGVYRYAINCTIAFPKLYVNAAFNMRKARFTSKLTLNLRKKLPSVTSGA
jgi:hypothetical protein